jgi:hypothetical protein
MHIYSEIHVLLLKFSYMFRRLFTIFRENFILFSKLLLRCLITDLKMYYTWDYNFVYNYLKTICFNVRLKKQKLLCVF